MDGLGRRIREARLAQGWATRRDAYDATKIPAESWENWESDRVAPQAKFIALLAVKLQVTADWLLGVSDDGGPLDPSRAMPSGPAPDESTAQAAERRARRDSRSATRSNSSRRR